MPLDWKWIPPLSLLQLEHLFEKIDTSSVEPDGCYLWEGTKSDSGYGIVTLNGRRFKATRVIYFVITGEDPEDKLIRHKCDNKLCVRFEHLIPGSNEENMQDAKERGRFASGQRNGAYTHPEKWKRGEEQKNSKLTNETVLQARILYSEGKTAREIASLLGMSSQTIQDVIKGKDWAHIGGPVVFGNLKMGPRGKTGPRLKMKPRVLITAEIRNAAYLLLDNSVAAKQVAAELNISLPSTYNIIRNRKKLEGSWLSPSNSTLR